MNIQILIKPAILSEVLNCLVCSKLRFRGKVLALPKDEKREHLVK